MKTEIKITQQMKDTMQTDGAIFIKGLFSEYVEELRIGIDKNLQQPGHFASENKKAGHSGRFFDDYCNWTRIAEFEDVIRNSDVARVAAALMSSESVQVFHDHVLVKEPGTSLPTPWHQDQPYYFVEGEQAISFWCPLDHVKENTLRIVAGSHLWEKPVLPIRWTTEDEYFPGENIYMPIPDPDQENMRVLEWEMEPGDAVAFNFKSLHGARGNHSTDRRRAFSLRLLGDDVFYTKKPGRTSPPFPGHGMVEGQKLREDWFPIIYKKG